MHPQQKIQDSQAVNFFNTLGVDTPNKESPESTPKEDPNPILLLSCMRITTDKTKDKNKKIKRQM